MKRFDDYHRTVTGYHGTGLSRALRLVNRIGNFTWSEKDYDWLGRGVYFWEYAPRQALEFARIRRRQYREKAKKTAEDERRASEPLAVVACTIRLGFCLDLTEPDNLEYLRESYEFYREDMAAAGRALPENSRKYRKLDRAVFEYTYQQIEEQQHVKVDTARGIYVPAGGAKRIWAGSWISRETHIQLCVRNPASLLGIWPHYPNDLGVDDVCQAIQGAPAVVERDDPAGEEGAEEDVAGGAD